MSRAPSFTNVYWASDKEYRTQNYLKPVSGHLGFQVVIPKPDPVTVGAYYYGENPPIPNVRPPTVVTRAEGEYFAVGNELPTVAGKPRVDPKSKEMKFSRSKYTRTLKI